MPAHHTTETGVLLLSAVQALDLAQQLRDVLLEIAVVPRSAAQIDVYYAEPEGSLVERVVVHPLPGYWKKGGR